MKRLRILLWAALTLPGTALVASETPDAPAISIQPLPNGDWQVDYQLDYPVDGLQFMRSAGFLREQNWQVSTPGYHFIRNDDGQALVREDGAEPTHRIRMVFPVDTRFINRDYELFNAFADGSLALFTGHFYVRPLGEQVPEAQSQGFLIELEIAPPEGKKIGLRGELSSQPLRWADTAGQGSYAYIGNTLPVTEDGVIAIFDWGLPDWVAAEAKQRIPELLAYYTQRMGKHSDLTPLVLFSYEPEAHNDYGNNGGTRPDLIQIRVQGPGWQQQSTGPLNSLIHLFAHEAAHLWNGQAARSANGAPTWMHEGSANAMAERAMLTLGVLDKKAYQQYQEVALNACLLGLADGVPMINTSQYRLDYHCGNLLALWSERALQTEDAEQDLFDIWQHLIQSEAGRAYSQADYFDTLAQLGVEQKHLDAMQGFVNQGHDDPAQVLAGALSPLGIELERDDSAAPESDRVRASGAIVTALLKADCQGGHGFYPQGDQLQLAYLQGCKTAQEGMRIDQIEQTPLVASGFAAYRKAITACAKKGAVVLGNDQGTITLSCPDALPELTGWWQLAARRTGTEQVEL